MSTHARHTSRHSALPVSIAVMAAIALLACGRDTEPTATPAVRTAINLSVSPPALSLVVGEHGNLTALAFDARNDVVSASVEWSSADPTVATVGTSDGIVTAIAPGSTTVTAAVGSLRATATVSVAADSVIAQWAVGATASSEWSSDEWSALQATGEPNVVGCTDDPSAWASLAQDGVDWLELTYARPVRPIEIRIHEVWAVGSIVKVEVKDVSGAYHTVYAAQPTEQRACPRILSIPVSDVTALVSAVRVSLDQRTLFDWNEIDAVRLAGVP